MAQNKDSVAQAHQDMRLVTIMKRAEYYKEYCNAINLIKQLYSVNPYPFSIFWPSH